MATRDMRHDWQPILKPSSYERPLSHKLVRWSSSATANSRSQRPLPSQNAYPILKRREQSEPEVAANRGHKFLNHPAGDRVGAQARGVHPRDGGSNADDDLPSLEEFWAGKISRVECQNNIANSQGTQDSPVLVDDDEPNHSSVEVPIESALIDAGTNSTFKPNKPTDPPTRNKWYDLESCRYVTEDSPLPQLEQDGLGSSTLSQLHLGSYSPAPQQGQINQANNRNVCTPEEAELHIVSRSLGEDGREEMDENERQLKRDLLLAFEEEESPTSPIAPSSPYLHLQTTERPSAQTDQEPDQIGTGNGTLEEPRHGFLFRGQHGEEVIESPEQRQEVAADAVQEIEDDGGESEQGEKRQRHDEGKEATSDIHTASSIGNHNTINGDNEDEEPRLVKRRRQESVRELGSDIRLPQGNNEDDEDDQELRPVNRRRIRRLQNMDTAPAPLDPEPACLQVDQGPNQGALEVLRDASPLRTRSQETAVIPISSEDRPQERAVIEAKEAEDDPNKPEQAQAAEKLTHVGEAANTGSHTHPPKCRASSQIINSEEDEEDKEPRPAKRRKRNSQLARQTPVHVEQHTPPSSRSPSARRDSVTFAEYQEWPFKGFLKRTRIGNETTYNLEFKLPCISELLNLPIKACDDEDVPTTPTTRHEAPFKVSTPTSRPRIRAKWTPEDDAKLVGMKKSGCSWQKINAAFPSRSLGTIQVRCSTTLKTRLV